MSQILAAGTISWVHAARDDLSLTELKGRPAIPAFYPADWSPVCGDQLALYNEVLPEFRKHGAELLGISGGATKPMFKRAGCVFRYSPIFIPRVRWPTATKPIARAKAPASVRCSCSTETA
jgi:hypothetical protein